MIILNSSTKALVMEKLSREGVAKYTQSHGGSATSREGGFLMKDRFDLV
jgi:hypothetical protein